MTSVVQSKFAHSPGATSVSVVLDAPPTPGNLLIAAISIATTPTTPVYPWGVAVPDASVTVTRVVALVSKIAGPSESATVTFSHAAAQAVALAVVEVDSAGGSWAFDTSANSSGSAAASLAIGPTGTLAGSDEVAVAAVSMSGTKGAAASWSDSFTLVPGSDSTARAIAGYKVLTSTAAVSTTATWTTSRNVVGLLGTYRRIPPAAASSAAFLMFM